MQFDFRSIYSSVLKNWFCVPDDVLNAAMLKTYSTLDLFNVSCTTGINDPVQDDASLRNYPNPSNGSTIIEFQAIGGYMQMKLYDEAGREIETIAEGNYPPGLQQVQCDTHKLANGIYFYTLQQGDRKFTKRMLVM
jgi:hypothetical protein